MNLFRKTDISAEIVQTPESETKPSEQIPDEQHIAKPTTEEIPKPVTDIVEEPRSVIESTEEESETKHLEEGEPKSVTTIEADNDGAVKELGTQETNVEENEAKPANDVPNGKNNAESITGETPKTSWWC